MGTISELHADEVDGDRQPPGLHDQLDPDLAAMLEGLADANRDLGKLTLEDRMSLIVRLKRAGLSFRAIGEALDLPHQRVWTLFHRARVQGLRLDDATLAEHKRMVIADVLCMMEALRFTVMDDESSAHKDDLNNYIKLVKLLAALEGLESPKQAVVTTNSMVGLEDNPEAAEFIAGLNIWLERERMKMGPSLVSVEGNVRPPLPPGMTEPVNQDGIKSVDGHVTSGRHGTGMWSMVLAHPRSEWE